MSKKNVEDPVVDTAVASVAAPVSNEKMPEEDRLALSLAKANREAALARAETADLNYKYIVLQLYMKNGLSASDAISEDGTIVRGGAAQAQNAQVK